MRRAENSPLTDSLGQIDHQTVHTVHGDVIDHDEFPVDIVDENGLEVDSEDTTKLKKYIKEAISINNLVETFTDSAHDTLLKLLALQDNKHPLKKGGIGIAYRTDALIMHTKMEFSADENIVFDAILGTMSSYPQDKFYKIEPSSFLGLMKYSDDKYLYRVFKNGTKRLKERHLVFSGLGPDGDDEIIVPWFNILRYHGGKGNSADGSAYIEFVPSDFFKDLALCSQLVHGAYGAIEVTTQLQGKYTIALYWYLENRKNYKDYPTATPGMFRISTEELKHQFSIPESYTTGDIKRRVLEPAKKSINSVNECDFTFDYALQKVNGVTAGYLFTIKEKRYIESRSAVQIEDKARDVFFNQIKMLLETSGLDFTDEEIEKITEQAKRLNKDGKYMMHIIFAFSQRLDNQDLEPINDKVGYLCRMIQQGASAPSNLSRKQNSYNDFMHNDYDFDDLEKRFTVN